MKKTQLPFSTPIRISYTNSWHKTVLLSQQPVDPWWFHAHTRESNLLQTKPKALNKSGGITDEERDWDYQYCGSWKASYLTIFHVCFSFRFDHYGHIVDLLHSTLLLTWVWPVRDFHYMRITRIEVLKQMKLQQTLWWTNPKNGKVPTKSVRNIRNERCMYILSSWISILLCLPLWPTAHWCPFYEHIPWTTAFTLHLALDLRYSVYSCLYQSAI